MGTAKRMCISQHMSRHSMQLKLALRMIRSPFKELTYQVNMYISRPRRFVNRKFYSVPSVTRISSPVFALPASKMTAIIPSCGIMQFQNCFREGDSLTENAFRKRPGLWREGDPSLMQTARMIAF